MRKPHRHAHEEGLRQLDLVVVDVQEVAVVERLQAEVVELEVARRRRAPAPRRVEVEGAQALVEELRLDALLDEGGEVLGVARGHLLVRDFLAQHLAADRVQQQPRGHVGVGRVLLDQHARGEDGALVHLLDGHAVVEVAKRRVEDLLRLHGVAQVPAGARR